MTPPYGTTIVDIADPRHPRILSQIQIPPGWHSHKVRAANGIMIVNHERIGKENPEFGGGLGIYDVRDGSRPKLITKWKTAGAGVHRFSFDGRYAYISPSVEGYVGRIVMILDLADPSKPVEAGRWWIPGQHAAGGEEYRWGDAPEPLCHHPLRLGDRLYVSYWHAGFFILDISDLAHPRMVAHRNTGPGFSHPTHTCLPIPGTLKGRRIMVVADEDVFKLRPAPPSFAWIYDVTYEPEPTPIATFQVDGIDRDGAPQPPMTGCHQPSERVTGSIIPFAWFANGMRLVDIANPFAPKEVGSYQPDPPPGYERASSNDVTTDERGLIYVIDRQRGLDILQSALLS
ncbi:MAG: hypothetical protein IVW54_13375 [Candidatus Binataceae bacterium]|nr:hypothetical protein [Candidatus Binataceae bacterium]